MLNWIRSRLTYANVMASIAVFIALGAGAYAAGLARDSVKSKHIVDGQVKSVDAEDDGFTGTDIDEGSLGEVPAAADANELDGKDSAEFQSVGSEDWIPLPLNGGNGGLNCHWTNATVVFGTPNASFLRDEDGFVHLRGAVRAIDGTSNACGALPLFDAAIAQNGLPSGYLPDATGVFAVSSNNKPGRIDVALGAAGADISIEPGYPSYPDAKGWVALDGISFRCGPQGQDGCP